jgi:hypothetical protein
MLGTHTPRQIARFNATGPEIAREGDNSLDELMEVLSPVRTSGFLSHCADSLQDLRAFEAPAAPARWLPGSSSPRHAP